MELVSVGPDLYACLQEDKGLGTSNSGLIARDGGFVVDTFWDLRLTRELVSHYATVLDAPARRVVNTHHNGDHCWGNQLLAEAGAEIMGHRLCVESFFNESPALLQSLAESESLPPGLEGFVRALRAFDFSEVTPTPPTTLLDGDTTFELDGLTVELLYVGPAHTPGDMVVWIPEHGVLYTGDILFNQCTPIGWEGTFANWIGALERLAELSPATVVPGHGPLATTENLLGLRDYLAYVRDEAAAHHAAGLTSLEAAKKIELGPYAGWTEPERLAFQVDRAYRELNGVPWDTKIDLMKVFDEVGALREWMYGADGD